MLLFFFFKHFVFFFLISPFLKDKLVYWKKEKNKNQDNLSTLIFIREREKGNLGLPTPTLLILA